MSTGSDHPVYTDGEGEDRTGPRSRVAGVRLHHLALTVTDLDASVAWYERMFGVREFQQGPHEGGSRAFWRHRISLR